MTDAPTPLTEDAPEPRRPTLGELALGGALYLGDNVSARLEAPLPAEPPPRTAQSVLRPVAEWDTGPDTPLIAARRVTVGMLADARQSARRGGRRLDRASDALGRALERASRPIRHSRPLRPVRRRFRLYEARGEQMVGRWAAAGRAEEARSRAVAEASLSGLVRRSVADLTASEQVQVLVQQVVQSQSTGLIEEIVEEFRERLVSLDVLLERRSRFIRRGVAADPLAAPPFRPAYLRVRPLLAAVPHADRTLAGHYAGFVSRFVALLLDIALLMVALSLTTTFVNALVGLFNLEALAGRFMTGDGAAAAVGVALTGLAGTLFIVAYGVIAWSLNGQTVGDLLVGVRVVRADGHRVSFGRAVARMIGCYVSGLALFLGFIWALYDGRRQGWHDKLAGTVVVYDWPAVPDETLLRDELHVTGVLPWQQRPS